MMVINGHKAAVYGTSIGLRDDELRTVREELQALNDEYQIMTYGYVPESSLVEKTREMRCFQRLIDSFLLPNAYGIRWSNTGADGRNQGAWLE